MVRERHFLFQKDYGAKLNGPSTLTVALVEGKIVLPFLLTAKRRGFSIYGTHAFRFVKMNCCHSQVGGGGRRGRDCVAPIAKRGKVTEASQDYSHPYVRRINIRKTNKVSIKRSFLFGFLVI